MKLQQGVQMFMIPTSKSTCQESVAQEIHADAHLSCDEEAYEALREPLGIMDTAPLPAIASPSSASCQASSSFPTANLGDFSAAATPGVDCSDEDLKEVAVSQKRSENLLKVGFSLLPPMKDHPEDLRTERNSRTTCQTCCLPSGLEPLSFLKLFA